MKVCCERQKPRLRHFFWGLLEGGKGEMQTTNFHSCFVRVFAVEAFSQVSFKFLSLLGR